MLTVELNRNITRYEGGGSKALAKKNQKMIVGLLGEALGGAPHTCQLISTSTLCATQPLFILGCGYAPPTPPSRDTASPMCRGRTLPPPPVIKEDNPNINKALIAFLETVELD